MDGSCPEEARSIRQMLLAAATQQSVAPAPVAATRYLFATSALQTLTSFPYLPHNQSVHVK